MGQPRSKKRVPMAQAKNVADTMGRAIEPHAEAMVLVGSIRRRRPWIGDVEFVVLPKDPEEFHKIITDMGFQSGEKRRKYSVIAYGLKVELYVARDPQELGGLTLTYTGDYLFNIVMRSQAKKMGYKLDQYGIWKGSKIVFQSPDEKEFFDFLGMDYHTPEERSLAQRGRLRKVVKKLMARKLPKGSREAVDRANGILKTRTPLPWDLEEEIVAIASRSHVSMGYQLPPEEEDVQEAREVVQGLYDQSVNRGGIVMYLDVNIAYNVVQVLAAVREGEDDVIYLLAEMTDLPGEALEQISIDPKEFLEDLVDTAGRGEMQFAWQGPWRPMVE